ncbi:hypothetical protein EII29_04225 [Leptotrichia sp. OH3620_COT-345]|uniref:CRISPR-associated endonuclease Cas6 n=1 Tax=Leptotrichia sp. OH3620_COT-345 TaxID=2491048 RepID=UPI000F648711|nr:CRISPR-associated endonuclease Cas6 [Leptotrichia sp. OH3620_COT-345]RRD40022.1 hypothetical protein EII29_04225 [Leptotrichia sp. OH3620_COT-345]
MKYSILKFKGNKKYKIKDLEKLKEFLSLKYKEKAEIYNYLSEKSEVSHDKLQYKLIKNNLSVMTVGEAVKINMKLFEEAEYPDIDGNIYSDAEKEIQIINEEISYSQDIMYNYKFVTPYLPLNEDNFRKYLRGEYTLNEVIRENITEVLKEFAINLEENQKIYIEQSLWITSENLRNFDMITFLGEFSTNVKLPDYFSLGRKKDIGYGTFINII